MRRDALLEELAAAALDAHPGVVLSKLLGFNDREQRTLWLGLHPAEEPLELSVTGSGRVLASARTSGAGPGYHVFICELLDLMAERFAVRWQPEDPTGETGDETGYFHHRDRGRLEHEMRAWLRGIAKSLASADIAWAPGIAVSMPQRGPQYEADGAVTALGPRDAAFWERVQTDDDVARQFFPWWEPGTGADYLLGRALCRLWSDVRWKPAQNDAERAVHDDVLDLLERGFAMDPSRPWPFAEWAELLGFRGEALPPTAPTPGAPSLGYRRRDVRAQPFAGVSIRVPGSFSESYDKRGSWSAWESGRTVWLSLLPAKAGKPLEDQPEPTVQTAEQEGEALFRVVGRRVHTSEGQTRAVLVSVVFTRPTDQAWAKDVYRSVHL